MVKYQPVMQLESNGLFSDCFSQSVLHVLNYFWEAPKSPGLCLLHPFIYSPESATFQLRRAVARKNFTYLIESAGIEYCEKTIHSNIVDNIIEDLNTDHIVMLAVDCFYDEMQKFTFGRIHQKHYLTVLHYEAADRTFKVVKHDYVNEDDYRIEDMSEKQLASCCTANRKNIPDTVETYICFCKQSSNRTDLNQEWEYMANVIYDYQDFINSVMAFFQEFMQKVKGDIEYAALSPFISTINEIYLVKKRISEYYWQPYSTDISMTLQNIAFAWRTLLHIALHLKNFKSLEKLNQIQSHLRTIISYEEELLSQVKANCEKSLCKVEKR